MIRINLVVNKLDLTGRRFSSLLVLRRTVHHKNGIRDDNRPENLELWSGNHPTGTRVEDLLKFAHEIISLYSFFEK